MRGLKHRGVLVGRLDGLHRRVHGLERVVSLICLDRELHVFGRDRIAIVEHRVLAEINRYGHAVVRDFPAFRQIRLQLPLVVEAQERRKHLRAGNTGGRTGRNGRIKVAADDAVDERQRSALV